MLRRTTLTAVLCLSATVSANAQWIHRSQEDPFKGKATQLAMTMKSGQSAAFRCSSADDLTLVYIIPEKVTDATTRMLAAADLKLLVIVDDAPKIELDAQLETTPSGDSYRLEASTEEVAKILHMVAAAKRRFAVASEFVGQSFYPTIFAVDGSRSALSKLISGCKVPLPGSPKS